MEMTETYIIKYWLPGKYSQKVQYEVKGYIIEKVFAQEKAKVPAPQII